MLADPLAPPPPDSPAVRLLLAHFDLRADAASPRELLSQIARAFSRIPYENLTKIIKHAAQGSALRARRGPLEVVQDHVDHGTGGTCFSLTAAMLHVVRFFGWPAEPILADRRYGPNTHCAMLVWLDNTPHLLDPGYLIVHPIALPTSGDLRAPTEFNELSLVARDGGARLDLFTLHQDRKTYRLTYRTAPVDAGEFLRAWDASFDWEMMHYPVLTRVAGGNQIYMQGNRLQLRDVEQVRRLEVDPVQLAATIAAEFGIDPRISAKALEVLRHSTAPEG